MGRICLFGDHAALPRAHPPPWSWLHLGPLPRPRPRAAFVLKLLARCRRVSCPVQGVEPGAPHASPL